MTASNSSISHSHFPMKTNLSTLPRLPSETISNSNQNSHTLLVGIQNRMANLETVVQYLYHMTQQHYS